MKEAYATFPALGFTTTQADTGNSETAKADGYSYHSLSTARFAASTYVPIDLTGLTIKDKVLAIKNIHLARLPSFDNTFPRTLGSVEGVGGIYSVRDMHLVTTSPIAATSSVEAAGLAPAQSQDIQMEYLAGAFAGNNGYTNVSPGILPSTGDPTELSFLNLDPNMIVFCQIDTLATNVQSNDKLQSLLVPVDSTIYGMGNLAALKTLYVYRLVVCDFINSPDTRGGTYNQIVAAQIGPSIVQMSTTDLSMPTLERLQVMDTNFNTTNPLVK